MSNRIIDRLKARHIPWFPTALRYLEKIQVWLGDRERAIIGQIARLCYEANSDTVVIAAAKLAGLARIHRNSVNTGIKALGYCGILHCRKHGGRTSRYEIRVQWEELHTVTENSVRVAIARADAKARSRAKHEGPSTASGEFTAGPDGVNAEPAGGTASASLTIQRANDNVCVGKGDYKPAELSAMTPGENLNPVASDAMEARFRDNCYMPCLQSVTCGRSKLSNIRVENRGAYESTCTAMCCARLPDSDHHWRHAKGLLEDVIPEDVYLARIAPVNGRFDPDASVLTLYVLSDIYADAIHENWEAEVRAAVGAREVRYECYVPAARDMDAQPANDSGPPFERTRGWLESTLRTMMEQVKDRFDGPVTTEFLESAMALAGPLERVPERLLDRIERAALRGRRLHSYRFVLTILAGMRVKAMPAEAREVLHQELQRYYDALERETRNRL